ncbi:E3 ubiquitin-protein ligase PIB1 [Acrodontium crateriforme]|uniref:RING-type E3 ubiquitin transferase n=1 Tax=Acrodontium crateriforme TaxID=150365 RepID=A0AAQ3M3Y7_9PEZI|nr:E3 ubiquitin-protein ligase PIB1 [Acrodontium crateriforme]
MTRGGNDPRRPPGPPPPSSASSHHRRASSDNSQYDEASDLTWLDFLRTAGGTVQDRPDLRKRRHADSEPEGRDYRQPNFNFVGPARRQRSDVPYSALSNTRNTLNNFAPPERAMFPQRMSGDNGSISSGNHSGRRQSATGPPRWQPDHEVARCPVCSSEFTFWFRKHHCRKCGRVVCAACSPHRITIPRQYVVQPEPSSSEYLVGFESPDNRNAAFGGGETVRVCNPCVPDPWTPNTSPAGTQSMIDPVQISAEETMRRNAQRRGENMLEATPTTVPALTSPRHRNMRYRYMPPPSAQSSAGGGHQRSQSHQFTPSLSRSLSQQTTANYSGQYMQPPPIPPSSRPSGFGHRHTQSSGSHYPQQSPVSSGNPAGHRPTHNPTAPLTPRRQIREEDECPVCGAEMPPGEAVREAHIQECIASRFLVGTPSGSNNAIRPPPERTESAPSGRVEPLTSALSSSPHTATARPRASSYRPRGMITYLATEKDCTSASGDAQECIICFEEFEPGDELGRMECLCKFHRKCIRMWWETKGQGVCPTHVLTDD